jgi:hypothetical protein
MPVVFIHGVTVRDERYQALLSQVRDGLRKPLPGRDVQGVYWGHLASQLKFKGATIPGFIAGTGAFKGVAPGTETELVLLLLENPLYELHELASTGSAAGAWARDDQLDALRKPVLEELIAARAELVTKPADLKPDAIRQIVVATFDAAQQAPTDQTAEDLIGPLTRSLTAGLYRAAVEPTDLDPDFSWRRTEAKVQEMLERRLEGMKGPFKTAALSIATLALQKGLRRRLMAGLSLFVGDVLHYTSNREKILGHVADSIDELYRTEDGESSYPDEEPLWLVGHSLGGIIAYEYCLLGRRDVQRLVTVGSQVGLLAEMGAVPTATETGKQPLPAGTATWINIFDEADMLSFLAEPIFEGARDVLVPTGAPFPGSHSEYWAVDAVYRELAADG